jgi:hypothetical protein
MRLRPDLFRPAVRRLTGGKTVTFGSSDPTYGRWLAKRKLPEELTRFLLENAPSAETSFDCAGGMWTPKDVMELNDQEKAMPASGLFAVGSAINGDFIVIDFKEGDGASGFVSHDLLRDGKPVKKPRQAYIPVARSIGEMLHGMTTVEQFPYDYWQAKRDPIMYDADVIEEPRARCLGNTSNAVQEFLYLVRGRLADRADIEKHSQGEHSTTDSFRATGEFAWVNFANSAQQWQNDMNTVVLSFMRNFLRS